MIDRRRLPFDDRFLLTMARRATRLRGHGLIGEGLSQEYTKPRANNWTASFSPSGYGAHAQSTTFSFMNLTDASANQAGVSARFPNRTQTNGKIMKPHMRLTLPFVRAALLALLLGLASTVRGGIPALHVTVFDADEKVAFRAPLGADGIFATGNLPRGKYVVQFNTKNAAAKNNLYLLVVSAGKKKVIAGAVPGEKFAGGGVAMRVDVGPSLKITGQVAQEDAMAGQGASGYRVIDGKRYVWMTTHVGSNLGGRWVEEGLAPAANILNVRIDNVRNIQDGAGEGSMIRGPDHLHFKGGDHD